MKKLIWIFLMLLSPAAFAQQNNGWSPAQQEQFRKQMDDFKVQMQQQMQSLRDSLKNMQSQLKDYNFSMDTMQLQFPESSEMPEMPELPEMPDMQNPNEDGSGAAAEDSAEVRLGRWNLVVKGNNDGQDHVHVYKREACNDDCNDDGEGLKNVETKFLLLDVGVNNYFGKGFSSSFPPGFEALDPNPGKSWVVNIHAVDQRLNLIAHHLWLAYGVYFELNSYKFDTKEVLTPQIDSVAFSTSDKSLSKNKLSCEYVGIPLMLRFESNPSNLSSSFHISAGGFGEYLLGAHTKTKSTSGKDKVHDDFNLNRVRYGVTARAGYGWVNVFTNISVSELLVDGAGPVLYPFSAGLAFEF